MMLLRFIDDTAYNSEQRIDNVNQIHLEMSSGKLVLQKIENYALAFFLGHGDTKIIQRDQAGLQFLQTSSSRATKSRINQWKTTNHGEKKIQM